MCVKKKAKAGGGARSSESLRLARAASHHQANTPEVIDHREQAAQEVTTHPFARSGVLPVFAVLRRQGVCRSPGKDQGPRGAARRAILDDERAALAQQGRRWRTTTSISEEEEEEEEEAEEAEANIG